MCSISWFFVFYSSTIHIYSHAIKFIPFCAIEIYAIWTTGVRAREREGARALLTHSYFIDWEQSKWAQRQLNMCDREKRVKKTNTFHQYFECDAWSSRCKNICLERELINVKSHCVNMCGISLVEPKVYGISFCYFIIFVQLEMLITSRYWWYFVH